MNKELSELIRSMRLIMVIGLVFVHFGNFPNDNLNPFTGVVDAEFFYASSLNSFFTYFFLCSVPVLSMISGYLYSYKGVDSYSSMIKKKAKTLFFPSIAWTSLWLFVAFSLYSIGKSSNQFSYYDQGFSNYSMLDLLNGIIGITEAPFAFQFWFVHDLVLSLIISPLLILLIKRIGVSIIFIPFILWGAEVEALIFFNFKVISFFMLGLYAGVSGYQPKIPNKLSLYNFTILIFVLMVLGRIYLPAVNNGYMPYETQYELLLRIIGSIAIISLVFNIKVYLPYIYKALIQRSGYAFYLHASHFPLVILVKQSLSMTGLFNNEMGLCILWIVTVFTTILLAIISAEILHKISPAIYRFLNGQRSI